MRPTFSSDISPYYATPALSALRYHFLRAPDIFNPRQNVNGRKFLKVFSVKAARRYVSLRFRVRFENSTLFKPTPFLRGLSRRFIYKEVFSLIASCVGSSDALLSCGVGSCWSDGSCVFRTLMEITREYHSFTRVIVCTLFLLNYSADLHYQSVSFLFSELGALQKQQITLLFKDSP